MDPAPISPASWSEIGKMLSTLWIVVVFIVIFAANWILGHNFIPSFVESGHIPRSFQKARIFFYGAAVTSFGIAVFFFLRVVEFGGVLQDFWADFWI